MAHANPLWRKRLRLARQSRAISQKELATLFSVAPSVLSRAEYQHQLPALELVLCYEALFGQSASSLFPYLYCDAAERVCANAKRLREALEGKGGPGGGGEAGVPRSGSGEVGSVSLAGHSIPPAP